MRLTRRRTLEDLMDGIRWLPGGRFLSWPYHGSPDGQEQDAHDALERAAASLVPGGAPGQDGTTPRRRRGRPPRIREIQQETPDPCAPGPAVPPVP
jgi:hypothetical protein